MTMTPAQREKRLEELYAQQEHDREMIEFYNKQVKATRNEIMDLLAPPDDDAAQAQTLEVLGQVIRIKEAL